MSCGGCNLQLILIQQLIKMNALLSNLTKFVSTVIELYSPLPFEMMSDFNTLNAYLRSYSENQQKLLEGFVNRLVDKLQTKMRGIVGKQPDEDVTTDHYDHILKHYDNCTLKNPDLKLHLHVNQNVKLYNVPDRYLFEKGYSQVLTQRSKRMIDQQGIKSNRNQFGSKQRRKISKDSNKENNSFDFNFKIDKQMLQNEQTSLKLIRSQTEFPVAKQEIFRKKSTDISFKDKKQDKLSKNKVRYESNENKSNLTHTSSLKIKLKPRATLDIPKLKDAINELFQFYGAQQNQIRKLNKDICCYEEIRKDLINDKL